MSRYGRAHRDGTGGLVAVEEDPCLGRNGVEHNCTVSGHDDLEIVTQGELLELQHQQLLHPRMKSDLHLVDQHQSAAELGDLL